MQNEQRKFWLGFCWYEIETNRYVRTHVCTHVRTYVRTYVCACVRTRTYVMRFNCACWGCFWTFLGPHPRHGHSNPTLYMLQTDSIGAPKDTNRTVQVDSELFQDRTLDFQNFIRLPRFWNRTASEPGGPESDRSVSKLRFWFLFGNVNTCCVLVHVFSRVPFFVLRGIFIREWFPDLIIPSYYFPQSAQNRFLWKS